MKIRRQSAEIWKINPDLEKYEFLEDFEPRTLVRPFLLSEIMFYYIVIYLEFQKFRPQSWFTIFFDRALFCRFFLLFLYFLSKNWLSRAIFNLNCLFNVFKPIISFRYTKRFLTRVEKVLVSIFVTRLHHEGNHIFTAGVKIRWL